MFTFFITLLVVFQVAPSDTNTTSLSNLSVDKALNIAYIHNPRVNQLRYRIESQRQQQGLSLHINDPVITYAREGIGKGSFAEQRWVVSQSLEFPLTSYYRFRSEQSTTKSLEDQLQALKLQLKADVKSAYTKLAYSIEYSHLARERVNLFESLKNAAQSRADLGESSAIDAMQAELQLTEAKNNMEMAYKQIMDARYNLFRTIGLEPEDQTYDISFPDTLQYLEVKIDQNTVLENLPNHPELRQVNMQQQAASFQTKIAKSSYLPNINLQYYRQDFGQGFDFNAFEIGITLPLWFATKQSNYVEQTQAQYRTISWRYTQTKLTLKKQAEQAWHGYETSRANILRFRKSIQSKSRELVNKTQRGYRLGELDLLTLLEAQRTYLRTQESYYQTLRDYYLHIIEIEKYLQTDIIFE